MLVPIFATRMCHPDVVARDQLYTAPLPVVLGHESGEKNSGLGRFGGDWIIEEFTTA